MHRFLVLALLTACSSTPAPLAPTAPSPTVQLDGRLVPVAELPPPAPRSPDRPAIVAPSPGERAWYVVRAQDVAAWPVQLQRQVWSQRAGRVVTVDSCATSAELELAAWPATEVPSAPPSDAARARVLATERPALAQLDRPVRGPAWLAVRLDGSGPLPCLRGVPLAEPLAPGSEYWCADGGRCLDMARGGGSPQCSGPCPWFVRLWRGE